MTSVLDTEVLARKLNESIPDVVEGHGDGDLWIKAESIADVCSQLKNDPETSMDYLVSVSAVDYIEYFEMVYHLRSISLNHGVVLKSKCWGREDIEVPSVTHLWQGADFQEREVYDLMGVQFNGHYNLKRLLLWEGFPGHPQRKDYLEDPR